MPVRTLFLLLAIGVPLLPSRPAAAQTAGAREAAVLAVAHRALEAISREDMVAFTDLLLEDAWIYAVDGPPGGSEVRGRPRARERAAALDVDIEERGFGGEVRVAGRMATVWLPYDLYVDGAWSHCGVDTFILLEVGTEWRIASLAYTVEQPPACRPHPDGPPGL
ncbi:MAG: hypothetical protein P8188_11870 [Gemmatimonadota bacterium]|jgi:hypothetical protein